MMASMAGTPRQRARAQTMADITRIGREHLAGYGAAALSLRAVARDLGVVSSAIYRYVASRDDLLTLLVVDGYEELADAVSGALAEVRDASARERFLVCGRAVRHYALAEPSMYALLYGAPVPGYEAPAEQTTEPGTRVARLLLEIVSDAYAAGELESSDDGPVPSAGLAEGLDAVRAQFDVALPDAVLTRGVVVMASLFGGVSFEVFGQYGPDGLGDPEALFEQHLAMLAADLGLSGLSG